MSDGTMGIFFNDATKIVLEASRSSYVYLELAKERTEARRFNAAEEISPTSNRDLYKKVTLMWHFDK